MQFSTALRAFVYTSVFISSLHAKIIDNVKDLPKTDFDFIIVGGGTGGNVVANRLSENPSFRVLVLEAGPSDVGVLEVQVPALAVHVTPNTPWDYNYTSVAQSGLGGRSIPYPRGHILGGCSSANYMMYTRASSEDWDRYAKISGDQGWSWNSIQSYFKKVEKWTPPADNHNITGQFNPSVHGFNGILPVSLSGFPTPPDAHVLDAIHFLGGEFTFNLDVNSGSQLGMGFLQSSIGGPNRASSSSAYLGPNFINRPNLYVLVNAHVSRLVKTDNSTTPAFRGVEFRQDDGAGPLNRLTAKKEIILSAGTVGTPHILLNSGIGDSQALIKVGVQPLVNLPDVGENLSDHPVLGNPWLVNTTETFETPIRNSTVFTQDLSLWKSGIGPFVDNIASHIGFIRMPPNIRLPSPDPAAGPNTPHYEIFVTNGLVVRDIPPSGNFIGIGTVVVSPTSRGSIKLKSNNPFDAPLIDPGLLATDFDKAVMRQAVKSAKKLISAPSFSNYVIAPAGGMVNTTTDAEIDAWVTGNTGTIFHPVGTASMSAKGAKNGVVDPDLLVKNITGVRVVDASIMPYIPSAHTQAPVYAIAERASDLIKSKYQTSKSY